MNDGQRNKTELEKARKTPVVEDGVKSDKVFKSTEIYKTQARSDKFFDNKKDEKNKKRVGEWIKGHKLIFAMAVLLVVVIVLTIVLVVLLNNQNDGSQGGNETEASEETGGEDSDIELTDENVEYQGINDDSELAAVVEFYDKKLGAAGTNEEKAKIYTQRAADLYAHYDESASGMKEQILADAKAAEELVGTAESAYYVYMYMMAFEEEGAEEYLSLAIERDASYGVEGVG